MLDSCIAGLLLQRQQLTLDSNDMDALDRATVAVAGLGGIGCPALEVLARNAVGNYTLADIDQYEISNARQLFMTAASLGQEKVIVAKERVISINPDARVRVFTQGITPTTYLDFCRGADVICNQVDQLASIIALHFAADALRVPVVTASRSRWPERHMLGVKVYDYRKPDVRYDVASIDVTERWGVDSELISTLITYLKREEACPELIAEINQQNRTFRIARMLEVMMNGGCAGISDKSREYLLGVAQANPDTFHKMAISPEEAMLMGILAGNAAKSLLLGRAPALLEINLYNGEAHTLSTEAAHKLQDMGARNADKLLTA